MVDTYGKYQKDLVGNTVANGETNYNVNIFNGLYTQKTNNRVKSGQKAKEASPAYRWVLSRVDILQVCLFAIFFGESQK